MTRRLTPLERAHLDALAGADALDDACAIGAGHEALRAANFLAIGALVQLGLVRRIVRATDRGQRKFFCLTPRGSAQCTSSKQP